MNIKSSIIAMALCGVSTISLVACGQKATEIKPVETQGAQSVAVGTVLSEPEKTTADIGKAYLKFTSQDEAEQSAIDTMSIAFDMTGENLILHVADGDKKANEIVYEIAQVGKSKVAKYTKSANSNAFKKDKKTKKATIAKEAFDMLSFIEVFGFVGAMGGTASQMQYKKCANETSELFGDVYVYELRYLDNEDELFGVVWVDKDTGVWVRMLDEFGEEVILVQELELDDVKLPLYK